MSASSLLASAAPNRASFAVHYRRDDAITGPEDQQLRDLLFSCFSYNPIFLVRRYFKTLPQHRWVVKDHAEVIVAHAAVHEKIVGTETGDLIIGGVAEVCVAASHRGQGMARQLMQAIDEWLAAREIAFALLFGEPKVYASSGYVPIENELRTDNLFSIHWNPFCGTPMVKSYSQNPWPPGVIDLRGPSF